MIGLSESFVELFPQYCEKSTWFNGENTSRTRSKGKESRLAQLYNVALGIKDE